MVTIMIANLQTDSFISFVNQELTVIPTIL